MRKSKPKKRVLLPDPRFHDVEVTRFVNNLMYDGKKSVAFSIFYGAIDSISERNPVPGVDAIDVWRRALLQVTPQVEVRSRRVGGANLQVPREIAENRKVSLAMKNLIAAARKRSGRGMSERLAAEIVAAFNGDGGAFRRKEEIHRMAEANKAFARYDRRSNAAQQERPQQAAVAQPVEQKEEAVAEVAG